MAVAPGDFCEYVAIYLAMGKSLAKGRSFYFMLIVFFAIYAHHHLLLEQI